MPIFVDKTRIIDRESLRLYVVERLQELRREVVELTEPGAYEDFWGKLHNAIVSMPGKDKKALLSVEGQLTGLPHYIDTWMHTAVDSSQRMDFFIAMKAKELSSGDQDKDYFWALQIRHDQLVGLVRVIEALVEHLRSWVRRTPKGVLTDPVLMGLTDYSVEDQVYFEAQKVHKEREKVMRR